jgi:GAF domain-containing protein
MLPPQKLLATEQQIVFLGRVLQRLREEDNVDVLIETTISYLKEHFDYKLIWIALYDRLNHILFGKAGVTPAIDQGFLTQRFVLSPGDLLEQVVIEQRPLGVADLRAEIRAEGWQQVAVKYNIQGTIILPIRYRDRCLGMLLLGSDRWGYLLGGDEKARLLILLGELGAVLYQQEVDLQYKQTKRADEPLFGLLQNLQTLGNLEQRLEAVVQASHNFVSPNRTNIYWLERDGRYFWRRMSNQVSNLNRNTGNSKATVGITVQELSDFYYALAINQLVWIGEARSSLKSEFTGKLLQRLQVRSLLAAPIIWQKDLLGFLAVESNEARIWTEGDKNFLKGAAGLISLVAPTESMEITIKQIQDDAQLTSQVAQGIYSDRDFEEILHSCAVKVLDRLTATRFLLLQYDGDRNHYQLLYQSQLHNRRPLTFSLETLKEVDWQLLQRTDKAVGIENLEEDLRFFNWRHFLLENGVRSLVVCNCAEGHAPDALLVIAHEANRSWTTLEKELLWIVSQQIGVIIRQWQIHANTQHQEHILQSFQQCMRVLETAQGADTEAGEIHPTQHLERTALKQIAAILGCPLTIMLSWTPGQHWAEIIPGVIANNRFEVVTDAIVPLQGEVLVEWSLVTDGLLSVNRGDLPIETKKWLHGSGVGQILIMALRTTADCEPTGIVVIADHSGRQWSEQSLSATETLICQLAWSRRQRQITQLLLSANEELRQLNWYKHRRLEDIQKTTTQLLSQMHDLSNTTNGFSQIRYQQLLRQLDNSNASMTGMLKLEQWQLQINSETMPIASLFKRSIERVDSYLKQQKLWVGVHGLGQEQDSGLESSYSRLPQSSLAIAGDVVKIELVLYELLFTACQRSQSGSRIDIWCRRLDEQALEISITDNGTIQPELLAALHQETPRDLLAFSILDKPPGLHLLICQNLIKQLKGELQFYQLPDGRIVSRLLLPLASIGN